MYFDKLLFFVLAFGLLVAILPAARAGFSCEIVYTQCKELMKNASKIGNKCTPYNLCTGIVKGKPGKGNDCDPRQDTGMYLTIIPIKKNGKEEYTYDSDRTSNKPHQDNYYIYTPQSYANIPDAQTIPFPICIQNACGMYLMSLIPKYNKN
jgi:hypothetical protein